MDDSEGENSWYKLATVFIRGRCAARLSKNLISLTRYLLQGAVKLQMEVQMEVEAPDASDLV